MKSTLAMSALPPKAAIVKSFSPPALGNREMLTRTSSIRGWSILAASTRKGVRKTLLKRRLAKPSNWSQDVTTGQIAILRAGPPTSRGPKAPDTTTPFVIEVETHDGPAVLQKDPRPRKCWRKNSRDT